MHRMILAAIGLVLLGASTPAVARGEQKQGSYRLRASTRLPAVL